MRRWFSSNRYSEVLSSLKIEAISSRPAGLLAQARRLSCEHFHFKPRRILVLIALLSHHLRLSLTDETGIAAPFAITQHWIVIKQKKTRRVTKMQISTKRAPQLEQ